MEELKLSHTAGGTVKLYIYFGKQLASFLKKLTKQFNSNNKSFNSNLTFIKNIVDDENLNETSDLKGTLQSVHIYNDTFDFFTCKYLLIRQQKRRKVKSFRRFLSFFEVLCTNFIKNSAV